MVVMGSLDYSRLSNPNSVAEVIQFIVTELQQLRARDKEIAKRIRAVRSALDALRQLGGHLSADDSWQPNAQASPAENPDLRRACRIALLESTDAVTVEEIFKRINRRGSFCFVSNESAITLISQELEWMAEQGEARKINGARVRLWQRIDVLLGPGNPS